MARARQMKPTSRREVRLELFSSLRRSLIPREGHRPQHAGRSGGLNFDVTVDLVGPAVGNEHEAAGGATLDAVRVRVGQTDSADGGGADPDGTSAGSSGSRPGGQRQA